MVRNKNFLIAEAGINHNGNLKTALKLVDAAKKMVQMQSNFKHILQKKRINKKYRKIFDILKKCELPFKILRLLVIIAKK